jgi:ankyrin repeat protein
LDVVRLLCEYGSDATAEATGQSSIEIAARNGHGDIMRALVEFGASIDEKGSSGCPPILAATRAGFLDCVNVILSLGADVNITDAMNSDTALHAAVKLKDESISGSMVGLLLSYSADTGKKNQDGHTPLQAALTAGNFPAVAALGGGRMSP